jgi:hypothetical protein
MRRTSAFLVQEAEDSVPNLMFSTNIQQKSASTQTCLTRNLMDPICIHQAMFAVSRYVEAPSGRTCEPKEPAMKWCGQTLSTRHCTDYYIRTRAMRLKISKRIVSVFFLLDCVTCLQQASKQGDVISRSRKFHRFSSRV